MRLEKVEDYSIFERKVTSFKANFPKGSIADNCYLLPDKIGAICSQGRLYQLDTGSSGSLAFLADEGRFYRLYLFAQGREPLNIGAFDKPVLAEVLYQEDKLSSQVGILMEFLENNGFHLHKLNRQFRLPIPDQAVIEEKLEAVCKRCKQSGFMVTAAQFDDFEQIWALWEKFIDPYAFVYTSKDQWRQEIQAGRLQCIKDETGNIVAAQQYSVEQKRSLESHIVVAPTLRGKGLAAVLLYRWLFLAAKAGCTNAFCWIAEDNLASLHLHKEFKRLNKLSAQIVRQK